MEAAPESSTAPAQGTRPRPGHPRACSGAQGRELDSPPPSAGQRLTRDTAGAWGCCSFARAGFRQKQEGLRGSCRSGGSRPPAPGAEPGLAWPSPVLCQPRRRTPRPQKTNGNRRPEAGTTGGDGGGGLDVPPPTSEPHHVGGQPPLRSARCPTGQRSCKEGFTEEPR